MPFFSLCLCASVVQIVPAVENYKPQRHRDTEAENNRMLSLLCASVALWFKKFLPLKFINHRGTETQRGKNKANDSLPFFSLCLRDSEVQIVPAVEIYKPRRHRDTKREK